MTATNLTPAARYSDLLMRVAEEATSALPVSIPPDQLQQSWDRIRVAFKQAAMGSPDIYACSPQSVAQAVVLSALTDLYPGGPLPDVYLLPRKIKGTQTLCWEISWRGLASLAARTGYRITAVPVFEGDHFEFQRGLNPSLEHVPNLDLPQGWDNLVAVYVIARHASGTVEFEILTKAQIADRRACAQTQAVWKTWPIEMSRKTAIRFAIARGLVSLDPAALHAFGAEGQGPGEEVVDVTPPTPRLVEHSGLAGLEELLDEDDAGPLAREPGEEG